MGSDFNYADMTRPNLDDFTFKIKEEPKVDGHDTWQIEAKPRSREVMKETGYSKSMLWVRKDNFVLIRAARWVHKKKGRLKFMQVLKLEQIDGIWVATNFKMVTRQGKRIRHQTEMRIADIRFNQKLDEGMFTTYRLEKGV